MNQRLKATMLFLVDLRSMIFAFAVFNFILIWQEAWWLAHSGIACVACPWYDPWSWFNEPSLLLVTAFFLRINRVWSWVIALILSGYLLGYFIFLMLRFGDIIAGLRADWKVIRMFYPYFIGSWDSQYLFALIILCCASIFLVSGLVRRRAVLRTVDNKALQLDGAITRFSN